MRLGRSALVSRLPVPASATSATCGRALDNTCVSQDIRRRVAYGPPVFAQSLCHCIGHQCRRPGAPWRRLRAAADSEAPSTDPPGSIDAWRMERICLDKSMNELRAHGAGAKA